MENFPLFPSAVISDDAKSRGAISSFPRASIKFVIALAELHCRRGKSENVGGNDGEGEVRDALSR